MNEAFYFLHKEERFILKLVRKGKGASDIATIIGLNSIQHASNEIKRIIGIVRFFIKNLPAIRKLYTKRLPMTRREVIVLRLFIAERMGYDKIAQVMGYKTRWAAGDKLKKARRKLDGSSRYKDIRKMIDEYLKNRNFRFKMDGRKIMRSEAWRKLLKEYILAKLGKVWYVWGGQAPEKSIADCSGVVLEVLKRFERLPEDTKDITAQGISRLYNITKKPTPGDLAFYGSNWKNVTHVMFYIGPVTIVKQTGKQVVYSNCVAGMSGGKKYMTKKWAKMVGAGLWLRFTPRYRRDFLGYRKVL